ncbi:MAG: hypothetical protein HYR63_10310 [Proteobacteria bacterium]|nr:hypothetical protein [Pseudomonadota bacterium]
MQVRFRCEPAVIDRLPRPQLARRQTPQWLKDMPLEVMAEALGAPVQTVKQCPPFIDAMTVGFHMPLMGDLRVRDGRFEWDEPMLDAIPGGGHGVLGAHWGDQAQGSPFAQPGRFIIKFMNYWTIELDEGWSLLVTHPLNRPDLPFRTIAGLVNSDRYVDTYVHFPAVWQDDGFAGVLPRGTPVAHCVPVRREPIELLVEPLAGAHLERQRQQDAKFNHPDAAIRHGVYRREFR